MRASPDIAISGGSPQRPATDGASPPRDREPGAEAPELHPQSDIGHMLRNVAAAPFIYGLLAPLLALDAAMSLYQAVCFRLWRIPQVSRAEIVSLARHELPYLNRVQRLNCAYCSYANGVLAYGQEIASRTEQYWCPIQHPTPPPSPHSRYAGFVPYGESHGIKARMGALRRAVQAPTPLVGEFAAARSLAGGQPPPGEMARRPSG